MQIVEFKKLKIQNLTAIRQLWEDLNRVHLQDSVHFKEHYETFSFDKRSESWRKLPEKNFYLLIAEAEDSGTIAYCVSTIAADRKGEIDSLFVSPEYRQRGIGETLVKASMEWLRVNECKPIQLAVSYGHESVLGFYQRLGFYPRLTVLELKEND